MTYMKDAYSISLCIIPAFFMQKVDVLSRLHAVRDRNSGKKRLVFQEFLILDNYSLFDNIISQKIRGLGFWGIAHALYRLRDQTHCVIPSIVDHTFQQEFLEGRLELGKVTLDPIELRKVRHIEDLGDV